MKSGGFLASLRDKAIQHCRMAVGDVLGSTIKAAAHIIRNID